MCFEWEEGNAGTKVDIFYRISIKFNYKIDGRVMIKAGSETLGTLRDKIKVKNLVRTT